MKKEEISRDAAERIASFLRSASDELNDAAKIVNESCGAQLGGQLKQRIAGAMTTIGWDILEKIIYVNYPELRPYQLAKDDPRNIDK